MQATQYTNQPRKSNGIEAGIRLAERRWRAEVNLCAAVADGPRQGFAMLAKEGIGLDHFTELDTRAIFLAIQWASSPIGPPKSKLEVAALAAGLLRGLLHWDPADARRWVSSSRWSPPSLALLFSGVPFEPATVRRAVNDLLAVERAENAARREVAA